MKNLIMAITACLVLGACGGKDEPTEAKAPSKQLFIYNWSDYIAEDTVANFEKETGIKVVYDVYDGNETLEAKLLAGASGYDVVFPSARPFAEKHIAAGIYADLDKTALSNWGNNDAGIMASLAGIDPGNAKLAPYMWGTTGIGYNVEKVREILGPDAVLDSWSMIFDPAIAAKLGQMRHRGAGRSGRCIHLGPALERPGSESVRRRQPGSGESRVHGHSPITSPISTPRNTSPTWPTATCAWRWAIPATCSRPVTAPKKPRTAWKSLS